MASIRPITRSLGCLQSMAAQQPLILTGRRYISTPYTPKPDPAPLPSKLPASFTSQLPSRLRPDMARPPLKKYPPPPSARKACKDPIAHLTNTQYETLDPTGDRKALIDYRRNPRSIKPGDILRVTFKNGDPFSGACLSIRLRGVDSGFLLRNELTRVGVEMWVKVFSPEVSSVEVVQRSEKRKRRARLYYMRQPRHAIGSVDNIVSNYLRKKSALTGQKAEKR